MRAMKSKLKSQKGVTLVEAVAAAGVLAVLALMLHTGLSVAHRSYQQGTSPAPSSAIGDGFMNIPDGVEDEGLPFN